MKIMEVEVLPVTQPGLLLRARLIFTRRRFSLAFLLRRTNSLIAADGTRGKVRAEITLRVGLMLTQEYIRRKPVRSAPAGRLGMKVVRRR